MFLPEVSPTIYVDAPYPQEVLTTFKTERLYAVIGDAGAATLKYNNIRTGAMANVKKAVDGLYVVVDSYNLKVKLLQEACDEATFKWENPGEEYVKPVDTDTTKK